MSISRTSAEQERRARARMDAVHQAPMRNTRPFLVNVDAVRGQRGSDRFTFRGRPFVIPLLPGEVGIDLLYLQVQLDEAAERPATDAEREKLKALMLEAKQLLWQNVRPRAFLDRVCWRWLSNPFGNATMREVMGLLGFFSDCRWRREGIQPDR